jgi:hypothetical protein
MSNRPRDRVEAAKVQFRDWWVRWFLFVGERGPGEENADRVFNTVVGFIAEQERKHGDASAKTS